MRLTRRGRIALIYAPLYITALAFGIIWPYAWVRG